MMAVAPLLFSLFSALLVAGLSRWPWARFLSVFLSALHLCVVSYLGLHVMQFGALALQMGDWPAPFGITFYIDSLSSIMLWISSFLAFGVHFYSLGANSEAENRGGFHFLYHLQMVGVCGAFSTGDLFNLYVWFEVLLLGSFALMAISGGKKAIQGTLIYVVINLFGSALFLLGLGLLYNMSGTLNFADLLLLKEQGALGGNLSIVAGLFFLAFAMKAGVVPLAHWLPASYPLTSISALALFAGLLTKVGIYTLMRFIALGLESPGSPLLNVLTVLSLITMLVGVLGAASSKTLRQILSYHIISQVGYMTLAVSFATIGAMAATIFYLVHHMIVKTCLFLFAGMVEKKYGTSQLSQLGHARGRGFLIFVFAVPALSLAGVPPLSGFWAKLLVLRESLALGAVVSAVFVLVVGLLTLFSMSKIWSEVFQKSNDDPPVPRAQGAFECFAMAFPAVLFCVWILILGLYPQPFIALSEKAARSMAEPSQMIESVLAPSAVKKGGP